MNQIRASRVAPEKADFRPALVRVPSAGLSPEKIMDDKYPVPNNVAAFLDKASARYGEIKNDEFNQLRWADCRNIKSPIEQLFHIAIHLVCEHNLVELDVREDFWVGNDDLQMIPQWKVGNYFVDFALRRWPLPEKIICVELDGHAFHDRDERQRRYEKKRDRTLQSAGYTVLHFTGAEITKDPCAAALEAFILATGLKEVATHPFDDD